MKTLILILLTAFPLASQAAPEGIFTCQYTDPLQRKGSIRIDLDKHDYVLLEEGRSPTDPSQREIVFSQRASNYCGYVPADKQGIKCEFDTNSSEDKLVISRNLLCQKLYHDGSTTTITTGLLGLNQRSGEGILRCSVRGTTPRYNLKLSKCRRVTGSVAGTLGEA